MKLVSQPPKPKGKIICCCSMAEILICETCERYKRLQPDAIMYVPTWKRTR